MFDQLKIGNGTVFKLSYEDFEASLAEIHIKAPEKKEIKETVPFSNLTYDFSKINGDLYWKERELECVFEIIADSPEELESKKTAFSNWIMNVFNEEIHSPFDPEYHYVGTYYDMEYDDEDCVEKTTATVTFKVYPYKVANEATNYVAEVPPATTKYVVIRNDSGHRILPIITVDFGEVTIRCAGVSYDFPAGEYAHSLFPLAVGDNSLAITNLSEESPLVAELIPSQYAGSGGYVDIGFYPTKITNGELVLYANCTAQLDGTYTLSDAYAAAFWESLDVVAFEEKIVGCWFELDGQLYRIMEVDGSFVKARSHVVRVENKPCTVKVTFYREVF